MKKAELIAAVAEASGENKKTVEAVLDALAVVTVSTLKSGADLTIPNLGKFTVKQRAARTVRNPQTGDTFEKPATQAVAIKPVKVLKDALAA